jgi:hypothetical protein
MLVIFWIPTDCIMDKPKYRGEPKPKLSTVFLEVAQPGEDD